MCSTPRNQMKAVPVSNTDDLGVLHPSNKNRPAKSRNLFTSTPMGGGNGNGNGNTS